MESYAAFIARKSGPLRTDEGLADGITEDINTNLFGFQRKVVQWALLKRKAAVFADTGLGKSRIELAYADVISRSGPVIIFGPLCTGIQLTREAAAMGLTVRVVRSMPSPLENSIYVTNYEIADKFTLSAFRAVVLDESSILKHGKECKTAAAMMAACSGVPFRLSLTATPCPNDFAEMLSQAEFLGLGSRDFLLSKFFRTLSSGKFALRMHAEDAFAGWLAQWSVWISSPKDIGFDAEANLYVLPPMTIEYVKVKTEDPGGESSSGKKRKTGVMNAAAARRSTLEARLDYVTNMVNSDGDEPWIVWATLNDESTALAKSLNGAVELTGSMTVARKEEALTSFTDLNKRVMVTKSEICGFGLNWQHCNRMVFVSITYSYEQVYQAIRRCHRFGQTRPVKVYIITSDAEEQVSESIKRKGDEVNRLKEIMVEKMKEIWKPEATVESIVDYAPPVHVVSGTSQIVTASGARMILGDCVEGLRSHVADASIDLSVFSPPFLGLYRYSDNPEDISNCASRDEFCEHMGHLARELFRVLKPGRLMTFHCMSVPRSTREFSAEMAFSMQDIRGDLIRIFEEAGLLFHSEAVVYRDPVLSLVQTKAYGLWYKRFVADSSVCRQAMPDHVVTMRKPGTNAVPIAHDPEKFGGAEAAWAAEAAEASAEAEEASDDEEGAGAAQAKKKKKTKKAAGAAPPKDAKEAAVVAHRKRWIELASPFWFVNLNDTVNVRKAIGLPHRGPKEAEEDKVTHPTPLAKPIIRNVIDLYSNPGETVLDPFSGIGSTGVVAREMGRSYVGVELAETYYSASLNLV